MSDSLFPQKHEAAQKSLDRTGIPDWIIKESQPTFYDKNKEKNK